MLWLIQHHADTLAMMKILQATVDELATEYEKEHGRNPAKYVLAELGGNSGRGLSGTENKSKDLLGELLLNLLMQICDLNELFFCWRFTG